MTVSVDVLGIRHHGPGSARSVLQALDELTPDLVIIEGPPELDTLLPLAAEPDLVPPVAGLVYVTDEPHRAAFYPFAAFSPEWVAMRWAIGHDVPVRHTRCQTGSECLQERVAGVVSQRVVDLLEVVEVQ